MRSFHRPLYCVALALLAAGGSVCCASVPEPLEDGRIQWGAFLLFGDDKGGLHLMKGSEVIVLGAGIFCGGDQGYWPYDRMPGREIELGEGSMSFRGLIPEVSTTYEQEVSIEGDRIRIRLRRLGDWPGTHWDAFFFWLPFNNYRAAQIRADGEVVDLPETYSAEGRTVVSGARRIECNLGDPSLNLVLECDRGMSVTDRRQWSQLRYLVAVSFPEAEGQFVDLFLTLPQIDEAAESGVRYSVVGYPAAGEKKVVLEWPGYLSRPDDEARLERADGMAIKQGRFGQTVTLRHMQSDFAIFDFSEVREPGEYRVVWSGGSVEFPIRQRVFGERLWQPTLDYFLPFQMCHAEVDLGPGVTGHRPCHMDDAIRVPANFPGTDGFVSYECEGTPYEAGDPVPSTKGGWHDAGDCDLNIYAQGFAAYQLALAYEEFGIERDVATLDVEAQTFRTGTPDGVPDLLQQIEWGVHWLLSMVEPDGRTYVGVVAQPQYRQHEGGWDESTDNANGTGDERHLYVDYHAELQLMQATTLSAASRVLAKVRPELAQTCLLTARKAFDYFGSRPEVYRRTAYFYEGRPGRDGAVAVALAELYMTTGEAAFLRQLEAMTDQIAHLDMDYPAKQGSSSSTFWYAPPVLARLVARLPESPLRTACLSTCRRAAEFHAQRLSGRPWAGHYTDFGKLGSNVNVLSRVYDAYWLSQVAPDVVSMATAVQPMLWLYGLHPLSDAVFVSGIGYDGPRHIHSGHLTHVFRPERGTVPGAPVPGITTVWWYMPDNVLYYFDDGNVSNMESTIYQTAGYLFAVNAMASAEAGAVTAIGADGSGSGPGSFALFANVPNPFNASTLIAYELPRATHVELAVYNLLGQRIRRLVNGRQEIGRHEAVWDGRDDQGGEAATGVYWYRLEAGALAGTGKSLLLR